MSRYCFEDDVVEDEGELAAFELLKPNFFNLDFCFDAIRTSSQSFNQKNKIKFNQESLKFEFIKYI